MRKYNYAIPLALVALVLAVALARRGGGPPPEYRDSRLMMDTIVEIRIWGEGSIGGAAALDSAFAVIAAVDSLLGDGLVTGAERDLLAAPCVDSIMATGRTAWRITHGLFDPTIGAVSRLWEFHPGAKPPEADSIAAALAAVGLGRRPREEGRDVVLDVGGIAKGYALEAAAEEIERLGFRAAMLNAGGDIKIVGGKPGGGPWRIAIRHPRSPGEVIGCLEVGPCSIATSGDYERFFTYDGVRYHHILDPRDGMPAAASVSVTVIGRDAGLCDALATGFFVMGADEALAVAESLPGIEAVFIFGDSLRVVTTGGLAETFEELK